MKIGVSVDKLWWGHRIPAWYDDKGNHYVGHDEEDIRKHYKLSDEIKLTQDEDVLDTWFSSALWPFSTLGWPDKTPELKHFYPTSVLVTGFDIIFFWVARMVMMGLKFMGEVPFKEVYITGLIRDNEGHKMSKTKGNVLDPIDIIDGIELKDLMKKRSAGVFNDAQLKKVEADTKKHFSDGIPSLGADALRFTYCALASTGRDIRFDMARVEGYRNFCNKIWNAARFVLMNTEDFEMPKDTSKLEFNEIDQWILSRLQTTIKTVKDHFTHYRFDLLANTLYEFTWNDFCDWYLEFSKPRLMNKDDKAANIATQYTLLTILESILRLLHPLIPFITEEIWHRIAPLLGNTSESILQESYPEFDESKVNVTAEK